MPIYSPPAIPTGITLSDLITDTRRNLISGQKTKLNLLNGAVTSSDTTLKMSRDVAAIAPGSTLSIGLETLYVWDVNQASKTVNVQRGFDGSTAAAYTGNGGPSELVWIDPTYTTFDIAHALNDDLKALSSNGLFQIKYVDLLYKSGVFSYDLAADVLDILAVHIQSSNLKDKLWRPLHDWVILRDLDATDFESGIGVRILDGVGNRDIRVIYKAPFTSLTGLADDVGGTGLPVAAVDLPPLGAAIRLLAGRAQRRNNITAQSDTRRAAEVGPGAIEQASSYLETKRSQRISEERRRLAREWPMLRSRV